MSPGLRLQGLGMAEKMERDSQISVWTQGEVGIGCIGRVDQVAIACWKLSVLTPLS